MNLNNYLGEPHTCPACGRTHYSSVKLIDIDSGATMRLPVHIRSMGYKNVFIIADRNTWSAAGARVAHSLDAEKIAYHRVILDAGTSAGEVIPDETTIGRILVAYQGGADLVLGIGSGTINDLCKFISFKLQLDYMIYATAPSMDGFVSIGSALMLSHVKTTVDCHGPAAVIGDVDILASAPMKLITAGLGDTLGKYTCLLDWKLSHLINGEYYCDEVVSMVEEALHTVYAQVDKIQDRDPIAVKAVMEALVLTGIAMSYVGNSRPASGCEHHLSHYWEMISLMDGKTPALHGAQVGVGMLAALKLYHELAAKTAAEINFDAARARTFDKDLWTVQMRKYYRDAADGIIALEEKAQKNDVQSRNHRLDVMEAHWDEIRALIRESLPAKEEVLALFEKLDMPSRPEDIGLTDSQLNEGILYAKEVRDRYTLLQMRWDVWG